MGACSYRLLEALTGQLYLAITLASGSGAIARKVMGTALIGGMLAATIIAIFLLPVTFHVVENFSHRRAPGCSESPNDAAHPAGDQGETS